MGSSMYRLKEMLCSELDAMTNSGPMNRDKLDIIDKLTHSIKSIETVLAMEESGYSNASVRSYGYSGGNSNAMSRGGSYGNSGNSYGGSYGNSYESSYGRSYMPYSGDDMRSSMISRLESMMNEADSEKSREAIRKCIEQMRAGA